MQYDTTGPSACMHVGCFLVVLTCVLVTPLHNSRQASCNGALWWLGNLKDTAVHCVFPSVGTLLSMSFTLSTYMIQDDERRVRVFIVSVPEPKPTSVWIAFSIVHVILRSDICTGLGLEKIRNCTPCWQSQISCPACNTESNPSRGCFGLGARLGRVQLHLLLTVRFFLIPLVPCPTSVKSLS